VVRFKGKHHETGAARFGIELNEPVGNNNGTVKGHKYFTCKPKHGVLCSPSKVTKKSAASTASTDAPPAPTVTPAPAAVARTKTPKTDEAPATAAAAAAAAVAEPPAKDDGVGDAPPPEPEVAAPPQESVVTLERAAKGQSFGFGIAQVYAGYDEKWVTVVSEADSNGPLAGAVGLRVVAVECERADGSGASRVDLSVGAIDAHEAALAALRQADTTVRLVVSNRRPQVQSNTAVKGSNTRASAKRGKPHCGNTVWCRCPRCSRAAIITNDKTRANSVMIVRNPTESMAVSSI